ncbi:MAG: hypothetical protein SFY56_10760 [Bacteroidota bacterium]|nr:hypothetical protein [Bacteroidota bacterium]
MNKILLIIIILFKFSSIAQTIIIPIKEIKDKKLIQMESKGFLIQVSYKDFNENVQKSIADDVYTQRFLISNLDNYFLKNDILDSKKYNEPATKVLFDNYFNVYIRESLINGKVKIIDLNNKIISSQLIHIKKIHPAENGNCFQDEFF